MGSNCKNQIKLSFQNLNSGPRSGEGLPSLIKFITPVRIIIRYDGIKTEIANPSGVMTLILAITDIKYDHSSS